MSAELDILAAVTVTDGSWTQDTEEVTAAVDGYLEGLFVTRISGLDLGSGTTEVFLATAIDNVEARYARIASLTGPITGGTAPLTFAAYLGGPGAGGVDPAGQPGFGRYVRVEVDQGGSSPSITLDVKALLKP